MRKNIGAASVEGDVLYTNLAEPDPTNTTDTTKWVKGYRFNSSGVPTTEYADNPSTLSNLIECKFGDVIRIKGVTLRSGSVDRVVLYMNSTTGETIYGLSDYDKNLTSGIITYLTYEGQQDGVYVYRCYDGSNSNANIITGFRFAMQTPENPENVIVTVNEEIIDSDDARIQELENRVTALENTTGDVTEVLPDYWESYLPDKISAIKALQALGGKDCFSFVFMTDMHYPSNLGKRSPALAKRIMDECNIRLALNGGDTNTRGCYQTKEEVLAENKQVKEMFAPIRDRVLQVEGNHDGSYYWDGGTVGSGTSYAKQFTEQEMFEEYYRANGLNMDVHFDDNSNAFYVDDVSNKVRYIGLNSMNVPNEATDVNEDGTAKYNKFRNYQFLQAQYDFLCNEALVTVPNDTWSVVVFGHSGIYNDGDYAVMVDVLSAYKDKTNCVVEYAGTAGGGVAYTNLAEPLSNNTTDITKWVNNYRISSSGPSVQSGKTLCNLISIKQGDIVRVKGVSFEASADRAMLTYGDFKGGHVQYVSSLPDSEIGYALNGDVHEFTILSSNALYTHFRFAFTTPINPENIIITVNEEIVEGGGDGYDYVSVNHDFSNAKGKFVAYFHGHEHQDKDYTRDSIKDIATRCDAVEEHEEVDQAERVKGTVTEQSFDVFTVNKVERKIYATKIGAGSDREISY